MRADKNSIGTIIKLFNEVAELIGARFSHGVESETDKRAMLVYPYIHINIANISVAEPLCTISVNVMIADRVNITTTENQSKDEGVVYSESGYTENENYAFVLQELYTKYVIAFKKKSMEYYNAMEIQPYSLEAFEDAQTDKVAGFNASISIMVVSPIVTDGWC
jgi:hypothetical protein